MSDPLRTEPATAGPLSEAERNARIEQLLLSGLDHYFGGQYEQAINIWTRVAFLERGHGRARAYIERARSALAERQRASEELLHSGVDAYHAGDLQSARELLTRAVDEGGASSTALVFLQRLNRLEAASPAAGDEPPQAPLDTTARRRTGTPAHNWVATVAVSIAVAVAILLGSIPIASWISELPVDTPTVEPGPAEALPIGRTSESRISRARALWADGRVRDALRLLDEVDIADPLRRDADRLKADLQRELLVPRSNAVVDRPSREAPR